VTAEHRATERLAQAFEALVPLTDRKEQLLELAGEEARKGELGRQEGFDELWKGAADMLRSYSDQSYVSDDYGRELTATRSQAIEVERLADDPPERVQKWVATVSDDAVRDLDLSLILDLLRIETDAEQWQGVAMIAVREIERRATLGEFEAAGRLAASMRDEAGAEGRSTLARAAADAFEKLASLPLVRHIVPQLRKTDDPAVKVIGRLCHTIGPALVRPLAEALAAEENPRAIRALREILLDFGAAGRPSVEQLKSSSNPAVRRTAIDLLRVFGGEDVLPELASMLGDADPQVQRDAVRAIVQIATPKAYAVLERVLTSNTGTRDTILRQLLELRDEKAVPLLCYVLNHTEPRGKLAQVHVEIIEALGGLKAHAESTRTLRGALYRGEWWAPFRTAALRRAAAKALLRIGTPEATAILDEAARNGSRGVRNAARTLSSAPARRERA
jgi:HEAT repeat protein